MAQIKLGLASLNPTALIQFSFDVVESMTDNANFPTPTPALADITAKTEEFRELAKLARFRDKRYVYNRNLAGKELKDMLRTLGAYVSMVAQGKGEVILSSGFDIRSEAEPVPPLTRPVDLEVFYDRNSGNAELNWATVRYALNYTVEMTQTNPDSPDADWIEIGITSKSKLMVDNLTQGTFYWFRVKANGTNGNSAFCNPEKYMAA